jgi:hypothetical protein
MHAACLHARIFGWPTCRCRTRACNTVHGSSDTWMCMRKLASSPSSLHWSATTTKIQECICMQQDASGTAYVIHWFLSALSSLDRYVLSIQSSRLPSYRSRSGYSMHQTSLALHSQLLQTTVPCMHPSSLPNWTAGWHKPRFNGSSSSFYLSSVYLYL